MAKRMIDWHAKADWYDAADGRRIWMRSKLERRFAAYLDVCKQGGAVGDWTYEKGRFDFGLKRGTTDYLPDFCVWWSKTELPVIMEEIWYECRMYLTRKHLTQFKRMKKYYPDVQLVLVMDRRKYGKQAMLVAEAATYLSGVLYATEMKI